MAQVVVNVIHNRMKEPVRYPTVSGSFVEVLPRQSIAGPWRVEYDPEKHGRIANPNQIWFTDSEVQFHWGVFDFGYAAPPAAPPTEPPPLPVDSPEVVERRIGLGPKASYYEHLIVSYPPESPGGPYVMRLENPDTGLVDLVMGHDPAENLRRLAEPFADDP